MSTQKDEAQVVIIGGGAIGLGIAYHLGKLGMGDVLLLERHQLTSGTSWHAAGIVGPLRWSMNLTRLAIYATELFAALEAETGQATGYRRTGGLWLAQTQDRLTELRRIAAIGEMAGLDARILTAREAQERMPLLQVEDVAGALWVGEDGQTNPVDTCMAYAKGARRTGVRIREGCAVVRIESRSGAVHAVETADGTVIRCEIVVNCAGAWSRRIGALAGVAVPVQAVEHMYVVTEPVPGLPAPTPVVRDLDAGFYVKENAGKLVLGGFEPNAKCWTPAEDFSDPAYQIFPEDWDQFEPFLKAGLHRLPVLQSVGIQHFMNGPEGFTPDTRPVMGEAPDLRNYFVAAGFNSIGIVSSAGVGKVMAEWILGGEPPMDLWEVDIARFGEGEAGAAFLKTRIPEAVENQFAMHWPYKQPKTGRDLRRTPLHEAFAAAGAVFGAPAGWERPLWFASRPEEASLRYSYGDQRWWPCAEREAAAARDGVALFELSPFTKIRVHGPDALSLLQRLCCSELDVEQGRAIYTQMLNARGGIEADVTVTRLSEAEFLVISGAATRRRDLAWISRHVADRERLAVEDVTERHAVLGVFGSRSRALLQGVSGTDLSSTAFPFASSQMIEIASVPVRATRIGFVGELGWELMIPAGHALAVHAAIARADSDLGLSHAGHLCLEACRMEKGFRHWGHDLGPDDTPLEAGLGFTVDWHKRSQFLGRDGLLRQREQGPRRHLLLFAVADGNPLLLHDEPIYADGRLVGRTTSGARGFRTGLSLCFGYVSAQPGESRADLIGRDYEIGVAGRRHRLLAQRQPPYDPKGERMRS
jgi:glycine cleavage system aminomethyltransferase T/glycine/D-amino acid oxidase-like deaminating enzyme